MGLQGKRILITRTRRQASELAALLQAAGAETILIPTIELAPPTSWCALDAALASLRSFDWVIFTSANAVESFATRARTLGVMAQPRRIAVVGPATAKAVEEMGLPVDLVPPRFVAESLAEALVPHAAGAGMLLVRAEDGRDVLPETLNAAGAQLTLAAAYRNVVPAGSVALLRSLFAGQEHAPDAVTFTSSSTATNLFQLLETAGIALPEAVVLASIGPVTSQTLRNLGHAPTMEAEESTVAALVQALVVHYSAKATANVSCPDDPAC